MPSSPDLSPDSDHVDVPDQPLADEDSTTGTTGTEREEHVGRVAGSDTGYEEEQAGERQARVESGELNPDGSEQT